MTDKIKTQFQTSLAMMLADHVKGASLDAFPTDAMAATLSRANAIALAVSQHFSDPESSKWSDEVMTNLCWALTTTLDEAEKLMELWAVGGCKP